MTKQATESVALIELVGVAVSVTPDVSDEGAAARAITQPATSSALSTN
jgi:hypothetical protein